MKWDWGKLGLFTGGVLFGTAGIKILSSKDAKKFYTHSTAAVLRAKDTVMTTVDKVQENCGDILADAKEINDARVTAAEAEIADEAEDICEAAGEAPAETAEEAPAEAVETAEE